MNNQPGGKHRFNGSRTRLRARNREQIPLGPSPPNYGPADAAYVPHYYPEFQTPPMGANEILEWHDDYGPHVDINNRVSMTINHTQSEDGLMHFFDEMMVDHPPLLVEPGGDFGNSMEAPSGQQADRIMVEDGRNETLTSGVVNSGAIDNARTSSENASTGEKTTSSNVSSQTTDISSQLGVSVQPLPPQQEIVRKHSGSQQRDIGKELLDVQARLCGQEDSGQLPLSEEIDQSLKEAEHLLGLMGRHFQSNSHGQFEAEHHLRYSSSSSRAPRSTRAAAITTTTTSMAVVTFMYLPCYCYLLEKCERLLLRLQEQLRRNSSSNRDYNDRDPLIDPRPGNYINSGDDADASDASSSSTGPKESAFIESHAAKSISEDLGKFKIFDSLELNAAYLVPLITLMINRLHSYTKTCLAPTALEYGNDRGSRFEPSPNGFRGGAKHQTMARISGHGADVVFETFRRVLNVATVTEQLISS